MVFSDECPEKLELSTGYDFEWKKVNPAHLTNCFHSSHNNPIDEEDITNRCEYIFSL